MRQVLLTIALVLVICGLGLLANTLGPQVSPWLKPIAISILVIGLLFAVFATLRGRVESSPKPDDKASVETLLPDLEQLKHDPRGDI